MNVDRLNRLIAVLEEVEATEKAFNINAWISNRDRHPEMVTGGSTVGKLDQACGTVCCALGYAALDSELVSQGLHMDLYVRPAGSMDWSGADETLVKVSSAADYNAVVRDKSVEITHIEPVFDGFEGFDAGASFFDITDNASYYLFDPGAYPEEGQDGYYRVTPSEVIARIREVIAAGGEYPVQPE